MTGANGHPNSLPKTADVVILGAGVMGTSIAFHLAKRKAGKHRRPRQGSCRARGKRAIVRVGSHALQLPPEVQLALISLHMFQNWQEVVGAPETFAELDLSALCIRMKPHV